jgi:hypothetical protein
MLARASFQNFKALKAVDLDLTPFTVIVGKNGSGKTSVLQGILDVCQVPVRRADEEHPAQRLGLIFGGDHAPARLAHVSAAPVPSGRCQKRRRWSSAPNVEATARIAGESSPSVKSRANPRASRGRWTRMALEGIDSGKGSLMGGESVPDAGPGPAPTARGRGALRRRSPDPRRSAPPGVAVDSAKRRPAPRRTPDRC